MQWQSVIVLIGLNQLKIVNKISIQTHFGKKMAIALPAAAVIMHLWVWHPIIAIKTFVVGFLSSVSQGGALIFQGFRAGSYFRRNIFHWAGSPVMMEIYHEKKSTLKVSSNAWIIQHGINTTGLHWCFFPQGGGFWWVELGSFRAQFWSLFVMLVYHDQVMIERDGWGDVCMRRREVKFDDPTADKQKRKHSPITHPLIKNES